MQKTIELRHALRPEGRHLTCNFVGRSDISKKGAQNVLGGKTQGYGEEMDRATRETEPKAEEELWEKLTVQGRTKTEEAYETGKMKYTK